MEIDTDNLKLAETSLAALFDMAQNTYNLQLKTVSIKVKVNEYLKINFNNLLSIFVYFID